MKHSELVKGEEYAINFSPNSRYSTVHRFRLLDTEKTATYGVAPGWGRNSARYHESPAYPAVRLDDETGRKPRGQEPQGVLAKHIVMTWEEHDRIKRAGERARREVEVHRKKEAAAARKLAKSIRQAYGLSTHEVDVEDGRGYARIVIVCDNFAKAASSLASEVKL